jgi:tetratricopeptide (TPR) repeat protein
MQNRQDILEEATAVCRGAPPGHLRQSDRLHLRGLLAVQKRDGDAAAACLAGAASLDGLNPRHEIDRGRALLVKGPAGSAVSAQLRAVSLASHAAEPYLELGRALRTMGRLLEAAAAYREAHRLDSTNADVLGELGEVLLAQGRLSEGLDACELAYRLAPDAVDGVCRVGQARLCRGEWDEALSMFRRALELVNDSFRGLPSDDGNHQNVGAHADLQRGIGEALWHLGAIDEAVDALGRALQSDPKHVGASHLLALALEQLGLDADAAGAWLAVGVHLEEGQHLEEAAAAYERALALKPDCLKALLNLGKALAALGRLSNAIKCFEAALRLDPDHARIHIELGRASYLAGDIDRGWDAFALCHPPGLHGWTFDQPLWDGGRLDGRTMLVWADQELGDTVHFLRYLPFLKARGARVAVECQARLVPLVQRMPDIELVIAQGAPRPAVDVHVPITLIPILCQACRRPIPRCMPHFSMDQHLIAKWRQTRTDMTIGLSWAGHPEGINAFYRFAPLAAFAPLLEIRGVHFVSLQMGPQVSELLNPPFGMAVEHLQNDACSMADTAALMQSLDLVITIDSLVAHLAGALAKPVWLVLPYVADWRWMRDTDESPLYPTMRLFRQTRPGDWKEVFERVLASLRDTAGRLPSSKRASPCLLASTI